MHLTAFTDLGIRAMTPRCRLKRRLAAAQDAVLRLLDATTLTGCAYRPDPGLRDAEMDSARNLFS